MRRRAPKTYGSGDVHIMAIDCGIKHNIIRSLVSKGVKARPTQPRETYPMFSRVPPSLQFAFSEAPQSARRFLC